MRILFPMLIMLVAGLALGYVGSTLYWSGQADRQFRMQSEWKAIADKQGDTIQKQNATTKEQGAALRNLTEATGRLFDATGRLSEAMPR